MPKPYSIDLWERVVQAIIDGLKSAQVAERVAVSVSFVSKLLTQWRSVGTVEPAPFGGHRTSPLAPHARTVRALLAAEPDLTLVELRERLATQGVATSRSALGRFLQALGLTRKKRRSGQPNRTARTVPKPAKPSAASRPS